RRLSETHSVQERLESRILAHGIKLNGGSNQNQRSVALLEGTIQPVEDALEITEAEMDEREPHRGDVAVGGARGQLLEVFVGAVAVPGTTVDVAEDSNVIDGPAAQLYRLVECLDRTVVLAALCVGIT